MTGRIRGAAALAVSVLPSLAVLGGTPAPAAAAGTSWLDRLNAWRSSANLPTLTENTSWSQGDYNHSLYMVKDDQVIIIGPVEPAMDRVFIGRTFCVVVLAGLGSMTGTLGAGLILGISESIVLMHPGLGAYWAPAVSFLLLLVMLGVRPQGLFGR